MDQTLNKVEFADVSWHLMNRHLGEHNGYQLVKHLLDSYNDFIAKKLDHVLNGFNPIDIYNQFLPDLQQFKQFVRVELKNPILSKPTIHEKDGSTKVMTPIDARNRNFTYAAPLYVDVHLTMRSLDPETGSVVEEQKQLNNVSLGKIPVMVKSRYCVLTTCPSMHTDECKYDFGGYFIVNGNEKVVISQDRIAENRTFVFLSNKVSTYSHVGEVRSVLENSFGVAKTTSLKLSSRPNQFGRFIRVNIHHVKHDIPLFVLFRALGIESDKDIIDHIVRESDINYKIIVKELMGSVDEANNIMCIREAREYLSRYMNTNGQQKEFMNNKSYKLDVLSKVLDKEFLPHVGKEPAAKAVYLGYMARKLISCYLGIVPYDDRDSYMNKRVDAPGTLLANLFRQYYGKVVKDMRNMIQKEINSGTWRATNRFSNVINKVNISKIVKSTIIESGLKFGLATGNWGMKTCKVKQGVAQVLNRMTYSAMLSHLRRINTPIEKTGKLVQPRKLHATQCGIICPSETPEGVSVGLVKNMSIICGITLSSNPVNVFELLKTPEINLCVFSDDLSIFDNGTKVFLNGAIIGTHQDPAYLCSRIRHYKRKGVLNIYTSIFWNIRQNEIWICTEGGRCVRPLYIVRDNKTMITRQIAQDILSDKLDWNNLIAGTLGSEVDDAVVEYMDVEEINNAMIAMKYTDLQKGLKGSTYPPAYTHLEVDPSLMLGALAGSIPFSNHNQAPRVSYQSAMAKQATGLPTSNYRKRFDTLAHTLNYPQKPFVQTKIGKLTHGDNLPAGQNVIVAIMTWTGYNQEDSIIMNQSAVQRGLFVSTCYRVYKDINIKNHSNGQEERYCKPDPINTKSLKPYNYDKLTADGFVPENTMVEAGDVIIGKTMPQKLDNVIVNKDCSISLKNNEIGFIDKNASHDACFTNVNGDGYTFCKVRVRSNREPVVGDKFASKHAQKGTVGTMYDHHEMPFSTSGIVPDIIINPHAIPSRMTIGQLMECLMGKACASLGTNADGSPFTDITIEDIAKTLDKCGMERYGNEILYNSRTGKMINCNIFMGPTYYQRLKHMVADKVHARGGSGPIVMLTRQPAEGRAREGGLRLGEMEVECNWAHGIFSMLKERTMDNSDNYRMFYCKKCKMPANVNPEKDMYECNVCNNTTHFAEYRMPYACKLLFQEIQSMGIGTRIKS